MFRSLALVSVWSHDRWLDVNHADPEIRADAVGPDDHEFLLLSARTMRMDVSGSDAELRELRDAYLSEYDGHAELHSHAELDDAAWAAFVEGARWPVRAEAPAAEDGPVVVNDLLTMEEAMSMWEASGATIRFFSELAN